MANPFFDFLLGKKPEEAQKPAPTPAVAVMEPAKPLAPVTTFKVNKEPEDPLGAIKAKFLKENPTPKFGNTELRAPTQREIALTPKQTPMQEALKRSQMDINPLVEEHYVTKYNTRNLEKFVSPQAYASGDKTQLIEDAVNSLITRTYEASYGRGAVHQAFRQGGAEATNTGDFFMGLVTGHRGNINIAPENAITQLTKYLQENAPERLQQVELMTQAAGTNKTARTVGAIGETIVESLIPAAIAVKAVRALPWIARIRNVETGSKAGVYLANILENTAAQLAATSWGALKNETDKRQWMKNVVASPSVLLPFGWKLNGAIAPVTDYLAGKYMGMSDQDAMMNAAMGFVGAVAQGFQTKAEIAQFNAVKKAAALHAETIVTASQHLRDDPMQVQDLYNVALKEMKTQLGMGENRLLMQRPKDMSTGLGGDRTAGLRGPEMPGEPSIPNKKIIVDGKEVVTKDGYVYRYVSKDKVPDIQESGLMKPNENGEVYAAVHPDFARELAYGTDNVLLHGAEGVLLRTKAADVPQNLTGDPHTSIGEMGQSFISREAIPAQEMSVDGGKSWQPITGKPSTGSLEQTSNPLLQPRRGSLAQDISTPPREALPEKTPATPLSEAPVPPKGSQSEPLENIVQGHATPVNKKIGFLDYLRTPSKVLEKIGLGKEAKLLRVQYDKYLKQLPIEIERIAQWSKDVSLESNARIFRWLDGKKDLPLDAKELKVATEIQAYFKDWAKKMKLPADKQISDYITHIFDRDINPQIRDLKTQIKETTNARTKADLQQKLTDLEASREFPDDMAKLIAEGGTPASVYNPFLLKRKGAIEYKQDTWAALEAYVKRATRKYHMDPALEQVEKASRSLEKSQQDYVESYLKGVNMQPGKWENIMDNTIKQIVGYRFGARPTAAVSRTVRQWIYRGTLGGNVSSAVKNLTQGVNTYSQLGEYYTTLGYTTLAKERMRGLPELYREGVLNDHFIQDRTISATKKFWQKTDEGLFKMFEEAEKINRGAAYYGAKAKALAGKVKNVAGGDERAAIEYAKELVRKTQFTFESIDTPVMLNSNIGKTLLQFQSYTTKQTEFIAGMLKGKEFAQLARYVGGSLVTYYAIGKSLGMDPLDMILPPKRLLEQGLKPPAFGVPSGIIKTVMGSKDAYGRPEGPKELINSIVSMLPAGVQVKKTVKGLEAITQGGVDSSTGKTQLFKTGDSPKDILQNIIFGPYSTKEARDYFDSKEGKSALSTFIEMLNNLNKTTPASSRTPRAPRAERAPREPRAPRQ